VDEDVFVEETLPRVTVGGRVWHPEHDAKCIAEVRETLGMVGKPEVFSDHPQHDLHPVCHKGIWPLRPSPILAADLLRLGRRHQLVVNGTVAGV
jgi:hypothetical protein